MPSEAVILALVTAVTAICVAWITKRRPRQRTPRNPAGSKRPVKRPKGKPNISKGLAKRKAGRKRRNGRGR